MDAQIQSGMLDPFGSANGVGGLNDPIFSQAALQANCGKCAGSYEPIAMNKTGQLVSRTFAIPLTDASVDLSYDVNAVAYGYSFTPDGVFNKFLPGKWSVAMMVALETGPRVVVNTQPGGTINSPVVDLFSLQQYYPTSFGTFSFDEGVNASLEVALEGAPEDGKLRAYAYVVPGMMYTWNTTGKPKGM